MMSFMFLSWKNIGKTPLRDDNKYSLHQSSPLMETSSGKSMKFLTPGFLVAGSGFNTLFLGKDMD